MSSANYLQAASPSVRVGRSLGPAWAKGTSTPSSGNGTGSTTKGSASSKAAHHHHHHHTTSANSRTHHGGGGGGYVPSMAALSKEMEEFTAHCGLTAEETMDRELLKDTVELCIQNTWPDARCFVFGSYATGLSIISSDVDIAVCIDGERPSCQQLWQFADAIKDLKAGFSTSVFADAKVPIVRVFTESSGGQKLHCDVTFVESLDKTRGVVEFQKQFLAKNPMARPLIITTKALLRMWSLNTVHSGGMSSSSIFLLVRRFLSLMEDHEMATRRGRLTSDNTSNPTDSDDFTTSDDEETGYNSAASTGRGDPPRYCEELPQEERLGNLLVKLWWHAASPDYEYVGFNLMDPNEDGNDVSAGTHRIFEIQRVFLHSAMCLSNVTGAVADARRISTKKNPLSRMLFLPLGVTLIASVINDPRLAAPPPYAASTPAA